jgi:SAM-dependent methyltransferase
MSDSEVYRHPRYYAIGYRWNTDVECDFLEAVLRAHGPKGGKRLLDIGCGAGRHLLELAKRGYQVGGIDARPEMVEFVHQEAVRAGLTVKAEVGDLRRLDLTGPYDLVFCLMDTFRFLLSNAQIVKHLRAVGQALAPGGLYVTDFWVPCQWDQVAGEIHQWEQAEGDTTVRVFYLQHPETADPATQTFEDELVFEVDEGGQTQTIRGGRTRTRLIMPQEFRLFAEHAGLFEFLGSFSEFDLDKPFDSSARTWRMVSILRKR